MDNSISLEPTRNSITLEPTVNSIDITLVKIETIQEYVTPAQVVTEKKEVG